jgi:hypothetical protein
LGPWNRLKNMIASINVTCSNCDSIVRVVRVGLGKDERDHLDCPVCNGSLFSWSSGVYGIECVIKACKREQEPDSPEDNA